MCIRDSGYTQDVEAEGGPWTVEESSTLSPQLFFAQLEDFGDGEAILIIGNEAYPGVASEGGWSFSWTGSTESSDSQTHTSGYNYTTAETSSSLVTISMNISGGVATGTWASQDDSDRSWSESDTWEVQGLGFDVGQIPSAQYLVHDFEDKGVSVEGAPLQNGFDGAECSGDCQLSVTSSCAGSVEFTATLMGIEDDDAYNYLDQVGQPYGS